MEFREMDVIALTPEARRIVHVVGDKSCCEVFQSLEDGETEILIRIITSEGYVCLRRTVDGTYSYCREDELPPEALIPFFLE